MGGVGLVGTRFTWCGEEEGYHMKAFFVFSFFLREKVTGARNSVLGKHLWA